MSKLKPNRSIQGLIFALASFLLFFLVLIIAGATPALHVLGVIMIIYALAFGFWSFYKTNNKYYLITLFYMLACGSFFLLLNFPEDIGSLKSKSNPELKIALLFFWFFAFWMAYVGSRKKLKYRGREIMELAARDIEEGEESYTERPRPAGVVDYGKYDIIDFGNHLKKNLVCMPFQEENRILLVPVKMGDEFEYLYKPDYDYLNKTWISFDFDGQVSVHISHKDYLDYKVDLAFDHLCESLGQLMITFADFYMRGDKVRIIDRLNSVKVGLFS